MTVDLASDPSITEYIETANNGASQMNSNYVVDVTYNDGSVALYGPMTGKEASEFIDRITVKAKVTNVVDTKVRVLNAP